MLSLAAIFLVFLTIDELVRHHVINPEFVALEKANAIRDANRVLAAMNAEVEHLMDLANQWASRIDEDIVTSLGSEPSFPAASRVAWGPQKVGLRRDRRERRFMALAQWGNCGAQITRSDPRRRPTSQDYPQVH